MQANIMKYNFLLKFDALFEYSAPNYDDRQISQLLTQAQNRIFLDTYYPPVNKIQRGFEADEKRRKDLEQLIKSATISASGVTGAISYSCIITSGSATVTGLASTVGLTEGLALSGTGIAALTTIKSILGTTSIEMSAVATGNGTSFTSGLGKSSSQGGVHPNGVLLDLPSGFLYSVEEAAKLQAGTTEVIVKPIKHDAYIANINNPYKKPCSFLVWRMDYSRSTDAIGSTDASPKRTELIHDGTGLSYYRVRYLRMPPEIVVNEYDPTLQRHCVLDETMHESIVTEAVKIAQAAVNPQEYQVSAVEADSSKK